LTEIINKAVIFAQEIQFVKDSNKKCINIIINNAAVAHQASLNFLSSRQGYLGLLAYCPTNAALESITRCLACELKDEHSVFAIEVGPIKTDMIQGFSEKAFKDLAAKTPIGDRIGVTG
jgi:NAD(P)-dependent dehydrogenase (short-subunit alcohol dehydrogenase family)